MAAAHVIRRCFYTFSNFELGCAFHVNCSLPNLQSLLYCSSVKFRGSASSEANDDGNAIKPSIPRATTSGGHALEVRPGGSQKTGTAIQQKRRLHGAVVKAELDPPCSEVVSISVCVTVNTDSDFQSEHYDSDLQSTSSHSSLRKGQQHKELKAATVIAVTPARARDT